MKEDIARLKKKIDDLRIKREESRKHFGSLISEARRDLIICAIKDSGPDGLTVTQIYDYVRELTGESVNSGEIRLAVDYDGKIKSNTSYVKSPTGLRKRVSYSA